MARSPQGRAAGLALVAFVAALAGSCRDVTAPPSFETPPGVDESSEVARRLTYSAFNDRAPRWSPGGDSIYYHTEGQAPFIDTRGLLAAIPAEGGVMRPLLPSVQFPSATAYWLAEPVPSDTGRLAYQEMWSVRGSDLCPRVVSIRCSPDLAGASTVPPALQEVRLRVRESGSPRPISDDPLLRVRFHGLERIPFPGPPRWRITFHPFHRLFQRERSRIVTPSWNPDATRVVLSDGLGLLVWSPDDGEATRVPAIEDAVQPSWSPDGSRIVFTRLVRRDSISFQCTHSGQSFTECSQTRTDIFIAGRYIEVMASDGSEVRRLGPGDEASWGPDSDRIVFRNDGRLFTARVSDFRPEPVRATEEGREPRISPDGRAVVFSRPSPNGSFDLWVAPFPGTP